MTKSYEIPRLPLPYDLETKAVMRQLNRANKKLAELKGVVGTIPNEQILINTLTLQEAKDSSEIENIVTTQDELYKAELEINERMLNAASKEVLSYRQALLKGFDLVRNDKLLTNNRIKEIQSQLEHNRAGFRSVPGTSLKKSTGEVVYTPPQDLNTITSYMVNLEQYINDIDLCEYDPLIKMAIIHHQFESIHPFYDGNGRTGRIINILYLVINEMLDLPILYLSRYITQNKADYYLRIQAVRDKKGDNSEEWERWILYILQGIEETAGEAILLVKGISSLMTKYKQVLRPIFDKQYKHELINNLFFHPYTKIEFMERDMMVQRKTATKYLDRIVEAGLLKKTKIGRESYYINSALMDLLMNHTISDNPVVTNISIEN